jgi:Domain of unknown function (DUF6883)
MQARRSFTSVAVDPVKLRDYCLSDQHPRGRHKARVFRSRLGLTANDLDHLRQTLLNAVQAHRDNLVVTRSDGYGARFTLDFEMTTDAGSATIRSGWILPTGQRVLRFVTCYVLR